MNTSGFIAAAACLVALGAGACSQADADRAREAAGNGAVAPAPDPGAIPIRIPEPASCDRSGTVQARRERARALAGRSWDLDALTCAGELYFELAQASPADLALQVEAMNALDRLLHYLRLAAASDMMGADATIEARLEQAGARLVQLAAAARTAAPQDAAVLTHAGLASMVAQGAYDAELLAAAIARDPSALGARAQIALGRQLFELPTILGGDARQAIAVLEGAVQVAPNDPRALYYLAAALEQELEEDRAREVMARMLEADIAAHDPQMAADLLRLAAGLAQRIGDAALSAKLHGRRQALLVANPQLQTRASVAAAGHGGEHPLDPDR